MVIWSPQAEDDFDDIIYYVAQIDRNSQIAARLIDALDERLQQIVDRGESGSIHEIAPADWRYVLFKRWIVFFCHRPYGIEVMRVIDGARDLKRWL
jgi:plasmid stabilization system protein ParE